jgi:hypothetical protein
MPSLTKKDFQMVAGVLHRVRAEYEKRGQPFAYVVEEVDDVVHMIAVDLARTNPAFDRQRFINAVETGKETT